MLSQENSYERNNTNLDDPNISEERKRVYKLINSLEMQEREKERSNFAQPANIPQLTLNTTIEESANRKQSRFKRPSNEQSKVKSNDFDFSGSFQNSANTQVSQPIRTPQYGSMNEQTFQDLSEIRIKNEAEPYESALESGSLVQNEQNNNVNQTDFDQALQDLPQLSINSDAENSLENLGEIIATGQQMDDDSIQGEISPLFNTENLQGLEDIVVQEQNMEDINTVPEALSENNLEESSQPPTIEDLNSFENDFATELLNENWKTSYNDEQLNYQEEPVVKNTVFSELLKSSLPLTENQKRLYNLVIDNEYLSDLIIKDEDQKTFFFGNNSIERAILLEQDLYINKEASKDIYTEVKLLLIRKNENEAKKLLEVVCLSSFDSAYSIMAYNDIKSYNSFDDNCALLSRMIEKENSLIKYAKRNISDLNWKEGVL